MAKTEKNLGVSLLLDFYGQMLTDKQREVVSFYYDQDLSLAEIAEHSGITRQGVRDSIKRAENQLFDCEDKLGLHARFLEIQQGLEEIAALAREIQDANELHGNARDIYMRARRIVELAESLNT